MRSAVSDAGTAAAAAARWPAGWGWEVGKRLILKLPNTNCAHPLSITSAPSTGVAAAATYAERQRASGIEGVRFQWVHRGVVLHTTDMSPKGINVHIPKGLRHVGASG